MLHSVLSPSHSAALQPANKLLSSSLGFSVLLQDTSTWSTGDRTDNLPISIRGSLKEKENLAEQTFNIQMHHFFLHQVLHCCYDLQQVVETQILGQPAALRDQLAQGAWKNE